MLLKWRGTFRHCLDASKTAQDFPTLFRSFRMSVGPSDIAQIFPKERGPSDIVQIFPKECETFRHCSDLSERARDLPTLFRSFRMSVGPSDIAQIFPKERGPSDIVQIFPKECETFRHCSDLSERARDLPTLFRSFRNSAGPSDIVKILPKQRGTFRHCSDPSETARELFTFLRFSRNSAIPTDVVRNLPKWHTIPTSWGTFRKQRGISLHSADPSKTEWNLSKPRRSCLNSPEASKAEEKSSDTARNLLTLYGTFRHHTEPSEST